VVEAGPVWEAVVTTWLHRIRKISYVSVVSSSI
jgi:hypothetical protein